MNKYQYPRILFIPLLATVAACAHQANNNAGTVKLNAEMTHQVALAEQRGRALFNQDQLAWKATDYALEQALVDPTLVGRFLAVDNDDGSGRVFFITEADGMPTEIQQINIDTDGRSSAGPKLEALEPEIAARYRALVTAYSQVENHTCTGRLNSAVLPNTEENGWLVYMLSATTQPDIVQIGGHTRIHVDATGKKVIKSERSAKSCLALNLAEAKAEQAVALVATHLVSDTPWETHVLQSLAFNFAIVVMTEEVAWLVQGDKIEKVADAP